MYEEELLLLVLYPARLELMSNVVAVPTPTSTEAKDWSVWTATVLPKIAGSPSSMGESDDGGEGDEDDELARRSPTRRPILYTISKRVVTHRCLRDHKPCINRLTAPAVLPGTPVPLGSC